MLSYAQASDRPMAVAHGCASWSLEKIRAGTRYAHELQKVKFPAVSFTFGVCPLCLVLELAKAFKSFWRKPLC